MISSLKEGYWSNAFVEARRISKSHTNNAEQTLDHTTSTQTTKNTYTVKKGDTLYSIAKLHNGVSVDDIMTANNLKSPSISPGMILKIPFK